MNRPSLLARMAGSIPVAILLFVLYSAVVLAWYQGNVQWWVALAAVGAALRTLGAVSDVRSYKRWRAAWDAMGAENKPAPPPKKKGRLGEWVFIITAAVLFVAIPKAGIFQQADAPPFYVLVWLVAALYLVFVLLRSVVRFFRRDRSKAKTKAETVPVGWMLPRASSSPSRLEATRMLPEYCARMLQQGTMLQNRR